MQGSDLHLEKQSVSAGVLLSVDNVILICNALQHILRDIVKIRDLQWIICFLAFVGLALGISTAEKCDRG